MPDLAPCPLPTADRFTTSGNKGSPGYRKADGEATPEQATRPGSPAETAPLGARNCTSLDAPETSPPLEPPPPLSPAARLEQRQIFERAIRAADEIQPKNSQQTPTRFSEGHPLEVQSSSQRLIHAPFKKQRWAIVNALWNAESPGLAKRGRRLGLCCSTPTIRLRGEADVYAALQRCRDRLCPKCAIMRGKVCAAKAIALTQRMNAPRFVTLTTASRDVPLLLALRHLLTAFSRLRRHPDWRSWVHGGIYALEITYNPKSRQWHPHLHLLVDGSYIPHPKLKALWHKLTGDSFIVDVRAVPDRAKAASYIAAYVAKPADLHSWPAERIREYAETLHGARMIQPFGSCIGVNLDLDKEPAEELESRHVVHAHLLAAAAAAGNEQAQHAREIFARMGTEMAHAVGLEPPTPLHGLPPVEPWEVSRALLIGLTINARFPDLSPAFDLPLPNAGDGTVKLPLPMARGDCECDGDNCRCQLADPGRDPLWLFAGDDGGEIFHPAALGSTASAT